MLCMTIHKFKLKCDIYLGSVAFDERKEMVMGRDENVIYRCDKTPCHKEY